MQTNQLQTIANNSFDRETARLALRERIQNSLVFAFNGGMFKATPELISFITVWPATSLYIEDIHCNPIHIVDKEFFLQKCQHHYQEQMNAWHNEYQELQKIRKGHNV